MDYRKLENSSRNGNNRPPYFSSVYFSCSVMSHSATPWTAAHQVSLSSRNYRSLLKFMSIESVIPSNDLILCYPVSSSNCCFLTWIQISQKAGQVVRYSHLLKKFPQFVVIHTVRGFGVVNKAEAREHFMQRWAP